MPTIPIKWLTDSNANKRYPVTHTKAVFNDNGDDLDTILSGLGGSLAGLSDTTITSPSNGQVLTYDGTSSKWINAASSGGGIQTLTSPVRIWDLDPGLYFLPNPCTIYYSGATSTTSMTQYGGGILNVWWQTENTRKLWNILTTNATYGTGDNIYPIYHTRGYVTSSSGNYQQNVSYLTGNKSNGGVCIMTGESRMNISDINGTNILDLGTGYYTCVISSSTSHLPSNLTLSTTHFASVYIKAGNAAYGKPPEYDVFTIRQDLFIQDLNKHYYRIAKYYNNSFSVDTSIPNCDSNGWVEVIETYPALTGNAGKVLAVNSGATGVEWVNSSGGTADYDFTHTSNTTVSTATTTITFAANQRCSQMITISSDLGISVVCNNLSDNYLWIKNTGSSEVDITINSFSLNGNTVSNVYMPSDGISVPAGNVCEIGIVCNADGAFITSRNDLAL